MEELLKELIEEIKKIRYALEKRVPAPSGGQMPALPEVELTKHPDGKWAAPVPENARFKPCKQDCGRQVAWVETQFGKRTLEESGAQHFCPNFVPRSREERVVRPPARASEVPELPEDVPF